MKRNTAIANALKTAHALRAVPELIVDWNMNRYAGAVAENTPTEFDEGFDVEIFPIESIVENNRPLKGINKARIDHAVIGDDYEGADARPHNGRFYIADVDDNYKYWTSPNPSDNTGAITKVKPHVIYDRSVSVNKIVVTFENTWASPKTFKIQTTTKANPAEADWSTVADNVSVSNGWKAKGQVNLYWTGAAWSITKPEETSPTKTKSLRGIRLVVTALEGGYKDPAADGVLRPTTYKKPDGQGGYTTHNTNGKNSFFDLIEISASLEVDLGGSVINVSDNFELSAPSNLYPIGTVSANQATLTLSNLYLDSNNLWQPGLFSAENTDSPFHQLVEPNAKVNLSYLFYDDDVFLGRVKQFEMYTSTWAGQSEENVVVDLMDHSKFFNTAEVKVRPAMWEGLTVPELMWRLMDSIGFTRYNIDHGPDRVTEHVIPVFYTDGEKNMWEVLDELAQASQSAIYFDSSGVLQIKTRDFALSRADAPVWDFSSTSTNDKLADIISMVINTEFEPNHYRITYQKTNWSKEHRGMPVMQRVWEPEGETEVLRATPLKRELLKDGQHLHVGTDDVSFWPYDGLVNIDGEYVRFEGKVFVYYTGPNGGQRNTTVIKTQAEYKNRNDETLIQHRHKNYFTGAMKIVKRGEWNTEVKHHKLDVVEDYSVRQFTQGEGKSGVSGFMHSKEHSRVQLMSGSGFKDGRDIKLATRGNVIDQTYFNYGTRFRFLKEAGRITQRAGLVINNSGSGESGYYIDVTTSSNLAGRAQDRADRRLERQEERQANDNDDSTGNGDRDGGNRNGGGGSGEGSRSGGDRDTGGGGRGGGGTRTRRAEPGGGGRRGGDGDRRRNRDGNRNGNGGNGDGQREPTREEPAVAKKEVLLISRQGGKDELIASASAAIGENIDYELDVDFVSNEGHSIRVWLNGKLLISEDVKPGMRIEATGRFGMFVRGKTRAEYEYLYAIRRPEEPRMPEDFSFLDKVARGYTGNQWDREWNYEYVKTTRKMKRESGKERYRKTRALFDEFGPIIHEVREYDVKFDPAPVLHSRLYMSNDWSAICLEYRAHPFGAKFILANTSRRNAVLNGEDRLSFSGTDGAIEQVLTVLGRGLVVDENEEVVAKNDDQIRRRGKSESDISNPWIQSKEMAREVSEWMEDNFSYGNDNITIEVFGNPLVEVGDVVTVNYPTKHVSGHFFVLAARNEFSNGISTTLDLRRRVS